MRAKERGRAFSKGNGCLHCVSIVVSFPKMQHIAPRVSQGRSQNRGNEGSPAGTVSQHQDLGIPRVLLVLQQV